MGHEAVVSWDILEKDGWVAESGDAAYGVARSGETQGHSRGDSSAEMFFCDAQVQKRAWYLKMRQDPRGEVTEKGLRYHS